MNQQLVDTVVHAVLYEGYILYPCRAAATQNPRSFTFGRVYPEAYSRAQLGAEPCSMQTECLVEGFPSATLEITARFLHPLRRGLGELPVPLRHLPAADNPDFFHIVPELVVDGRPHAGCREVVERAVNLPAFTLQDLLDEAREIPFSFPASRALEPIRDQAGLIAGVIVREQEAVAGLVELSAEPVAAAVTRVGVRLVNRTPEPRAGFDDPDELALRAFASTHTILRVHDGAFLSMIDPPDAYAQAAALCRNLGAWPVLVGDEARHERDTLLSSPIILYDYPRIDPASPGGLFAPGPIDEILPLRLQTLPDDEKREPRRDLPFPLAH
jgi:hypothetical protein